VFVIGSVVWLSARSTWTRSYADELYFWLFLLAIVPYYIALFRSDRFSRQTTILSLFLAGAAAIGLAFVAGLTSANLGTFAFAGFSACVYLCGIKFFGRDDDRLSALALLGGIGVGVTAIVLSFEESWYFAGRHSWSVEGVPHAVGIAIQLIFPLVAIAIFITDVFRARIRFSLAAGALPIVAGIGWLIADRADVTQRGSDNPYAFAAALLLDLYALVLGAELLGRGIKVNSTARANFGLLIIVALAFARFFDSDLSFVTRGLAFIVVGAVFLVANVILFKRRAAAAS
jgi:hypothetical protein